MVITKEKIEISTVHAKLALGVTCISIFASVIALGIYIGGIQSVNAQQTKDIDDLKSQSITVREFNAFREDIKGLIQTYLSQSKNK